MGYPNQLKSARITGGTPISQGPGKVGNAEQAVADALGIPIDEDFAAKVVVNASEKGVANGVATLGADGKVPSSQLPAGAAFGGAFVYRDTTNQALVAGANYLLFNAEKFDTDGYHDNTTNPDRITVPAGKAGYYLVTAFCSIDAGILVELRILVNAGGYPFSGTPPAVYVGSGARVQTTWVVYLNVGDYLRVNCNVPSGTPNALAGEGNTFAAAVLLGS